MRIKWTWIAVACLIILLAVFNWVDLRLMRSQTAASSTVAASHSPSGAVPDVAVTGLSVEGNQRLQRSLEAELREFLTGLQGVGDVKPAGSAEVGTDSARIAVRFLDSEFFWTPLYARSQVNVRVAYSSNGDTSFIDSETPHFTGVSGDRPTVRFVANYSQDDFSWGLVSKPGYESYLAEQIAARVKASVEEQIKNG